MAAILFKNTVINATHEEDGADFWVTLSQELKAQIKEALMFQLG
jgi:hypothetical protein